MSSSIDTSIELPLAPTQNTSTPINDASIELSPQPDTTPITTTIPTIRQLNGLDITCSEVLDRDNNFILEMQYVPATELLYKKLCAEQDTMSAIIKHHLGLGDQVICAIAGPHRWMRGSFNVCVPIKVRSPGLETQHLLLRCAMPHKLAEAHLPGSVDEKVGCEVGTYAWIQEHCPEIRIPRLYGFGFSDQRHFTHEAQRPRYVRVINYLRRLLHTLLGRPSLLTRYTQNPTSHHLSTAYMILENIRSDQSQMLSNTWDIHRKDPVHRHTLFRGMARIMLSLARIPQPRIGSFRFHNNGTVTLTNRPLICTTMILENEGTPMAMQRDTTYTTTEPFVADMFAFHDQRLLHHPNMIYNDKDCHNEMAAKLLTRMVAHRYIRQDQRNGPFLLQLNDLHASNIFVDADWNITSLIDLEWVCALPVEILDVPYWLTGCDIGQLNKERLDEFDEVRKEFVGIFEAEACNIVAQHDIPIARIMRETWESGGVWFWHGIISTNAMGLLFMQHINPLFLSRRLRFKEQELLSSYWSEDASVVVQRKVDEYQQYRKEVEMLFNTEHIEVDAETQV